jgi:hypothetical protein
MALRAVDDHPKLARLKCLLKCGRWQAMGCLEAMWHFAGRFTPQGNIGKYSDAEIEAWVEWDGEPGQMVYALRESGWLDESAEHRILVHDWHEHADDATRLALKRKKIGFLTLKGAIVGTPTDNRPDLVPTASGLPVPVPEPEPEKLELPLSSPSAPADGPVRPEDFANAWNQRRGQLPKVDKFTDGRKRKVIARIRAGLTIDRFIEAVENCRAKPFLAGDNDRGWVATFDWLVANSENVEKAISNPYGLNKNGGESSGASKPSATKQRVDNNRRAIAEALARRGVGGPWDTSRADGEAVPEPGHGGVDRGISDRLRTVEPEIFSAEGGRGAG